MKSPSYAFSLLAVSVLAGVLALPGSSWGGEAPSGAANPLSDGGWYRPPEEFGSVRYIVVTGRRFLEDWKPFVQWKCRKGVPTDVVAVEDVLNNTLYRGTDGPETLRNFIADLYWKWGLEWALLGGDVDVVPARMIQTGDDGEQAADLYYSALDGSWNSNCDDRYGGTEDRTDQVEEVYVGRVPVESPEEIKAWMDKFFLYVKPVHRDYQTRALLVGAILGSDATWDADDHYKEIKEDAFGPAGFEVTELEESENLRGDLEEWKDPDGTVQESAYLFGSSNGRAGPSDLKHFVQYVNRGTGVLSHIIHSNVYLMGLGHGWITREHVPQLTNRERPTVVFSSGCQVNMFNMESISEAVLLHPNGGAVAFIGCTVNSYAFQNKFERDFWEALFFHDVHQIGKTLAASKARRNAKTTNIPSDPITILNRGLNLLGDPEMSIWTKTPADLAVQAPREAPLGESTLDVKVFSDGQPLRDALVCLWKEGEHHATVLTGVDGTATIPLRCRFPGTATLTVSARNHVPFEADVNCGDAGKPLGAVADLAVADGAEGLLDAGEKAEVPLALWNGGLGTVAGVTVRVAGVEGKIQVVQAEAAFPDAGPQSAALSTKTLVLKADADAPPGHRAVLRLACKDGSGRTWTDTLPVFVNASWVVRLGQALDDKASDGDGRLTIDDCGKSVKLVLELGNLGSGTARSVNVSLSVTNAGITVKNGTVLVGDVPVGVRVPMAEPFVLEVGDDFDGAALDCTLSIASRTGTSRTEQFYIQEPLDPPQELRARGRLDSIRVSWEPSGNERIAGYNVYRAGAPEGPWRRVNPTLLTASCFEDTGLARIAGFWYRVTALDRSLNESIPSPALAGRTVYGAQRDWPKEINGGVLEVLAADLDLDGDLEIGTADHDGPWVWHHSGREVHHGGDYWTFGLFRRSGASDSPAFADVDGKPGLEVVAVSHQGGRPNFKFVNGELQVTPGEGGTAKLHVWTLDGKDVPGFPKNLNGPVPVPPLAADFDGDGAVEILVYKKNGDLAAYKKDGSSFGPKPLFKAGKDPVTPPLAADLDGDGDLEIVGVGGDGKLFSLHHDGKPAGLAADVKAGENGTAVAAGDLDGDGKPEILCAGDDGKKLFAFKADGSAVAGFPVSLGPLGQVAEPALGDLDGDGKAEVFVGGGGKVYGFTGGGKPLAGFPVTLPTACMGIAVADVDGDGALEIVAAAFGGIHGFEAGGKALPGWPLLPTADRDGELRTAPLVCDVDGDGDLEIVAGVADHVHIWDLPAQYDPGRVHWGGYYGGSGRMGLWRPAGPAPASVTVTGADAPTVAWAEVDGAAGYLVFRGTDDGTLGRVTPTAVTGASWRDAGATGGAPYTYAVCAVDRFGRPSPLSPAAAWEDPRPASLLREGEEAAKGGKTDAAGQAFRRLVSAYPKSRLVRAARTALGALGKGGDASSWRDDVRRAIALGDLWAREGRRVRAAQCYRKALELDPDAPSAEEARIRMEKLKD